MGGGEGGKEGNEEEETEGGKERERDEGGRRETGEKRYARRQIGRGESRLGKKEGRRESHSYSRFSIPMLEGGICL